MRKKYLLKNLDCPNCANKIETALKKIDGVESAEINFVTTTLVLVLNKDMDITSNVQKVVNQYEASVLVVEKEIIDKSIDAINKRNDSNQKMLLIIGAILFGIGVIIKNTINDSNYISLPIFLLSYVLLGGTVVLKAIKNITKGQIFDENFLMSIATIGAFIIGDISEAVGVMLFYQVGEFFQNMAVKKSKKSIAELMDIRPDYANLVIDGKIEKVSPEVVKVGDHIIVKPGEKISHDGKVINGESMIDTSSLTGESVPKNISKDDNVISGCINQTGVLECEVTKEYGESTVSKIIELVENASSKKAPTENFITTFSKYYTPVVVILATLLTIIPPLFFNGIWSNWINRGLIFLVISCPCALVISIPLSFFGGIGNASRKGILIKGSNYLEALNNLDIVVFDKTGTLTKGTFEVTKINPIDGITKEKLLEVAAKAEIFSNHPISFSILNAYGKEVNREDIKNYQVIPGYGISINTNKEHILVGNSKLMVENNITFAESNEIGTKVYVAVNKIYNGCIVISDEIKKDSYKATMLLRDKGIRKLVMLTGDDKTIGNSIASELKLDEVYAELLPNQKVEIVEKLNNIKRPKGRLAFIGDGINDAPVLAISDIGIAMGGLGSDAAIEASDIVLMTDEPSKLIDAINVAKATKRIVWQNIVFALAIKLMFLVLGAFGIASMWEAVFADVGVSVIAVFNAMRVLKMK